MKKLFLINKIFYLEWLEWEKNLFCNVFSESNPEKNQQLTELIFQARKKWENTKKMTMKLRFWILCSKIGGIFENNCF